MRQAGARVFLRGGLRWRDLCQSLCAVLLTAVKERVLSIFTQDHIN
jgi:hypothetical protein